MEKQGHITIKTEGKHGGQKLAPNSYDIRDIKELLEQVDILLFPSSRKNRPLISYRIEEGSVVHHFTTSQQAVIEFNAILNYINKEQNIDFLEADTARVLETLQQSARKRGWSYTIGTSVAKADSLTIDARTNFIRSDQYWMEAELYFYGKVTNAGGKEKANIHISTEEWGTLRVYTPIPVLEKMEANMLYKNYGVRAKGKQHIETGEIDKNSLKFIEFIDYDPAYKADYLKSLRKKSRHWIKDLDKQAWMDELRGR